MCTAITFKTKDHYFGRNLDLEYSYGESVIVTPRNFPLNFRCEKPVTNHYAIIGIGITEDNYPLYYDATNEMGLSMAGLNFPGNAVYSEPQQGKYNITPYELIPWILGQCKTVNDAKVLLSKLTLVNIPFNHQFPLTPLHWIIADSMSALTVEPTANGIRIYDNIPGVLTNNPPFDYHLQNLANYLNLTRDEPINRFAPDLDIAPYSRGMGAMGLPGDLSSSSRFIRAAFTKLNSHCGESENDSITQFFHILGAVTQQAGCVKLSTGFEKTVYTSCCNTDRGIYYYTTYDNRQISGVDMYHENLGGHKLVSYPLLNKQQIRMEN